MSVMRSQTVAKDTKKGQFPGPRFINNFSTMIQIQWKFDLNLYLNVIRLSHLYNGIAFL